MQDSPLAFPDAENRGERGLGSATNSQFQREKERCFPLFFSSLFHRSAPLPFSLFRGDSIPEVVLLLLLLLVVVVVLIGLVELSSLRSPRPPPSTQRRLLLLLRCGY